jgi:PAS domain S-box-containing protein
MVPGTVKQEQAFRYFAAVVAVLATAAITSAIQPLVAPVVVPPFILAIAVVTLYNGWRPGLLSAVLSFGALRYWFFAPIGTFRVDNRADLGRQYTFLVITVAVLLVAGRLHRQRTRLKEQLRENDRLRRQAEETLAEAEVATRQAMTASDEAAEEASKARDAALEAELAAQEAAEALLRQQEAERTLRDAEAQLADFFNTAAIALHWVAADGTILRANQAELDMLGYTAEEYIGRNITEFHADRPVVEDILCRLLGGERIRAYSARLRCKDGKIKDVEIDSSAYIRNGEFAHTRCFTRDVTDEKRARDAVARLAAIVSCSSDAIVGKTLDGVITSWNAAAERIFQYSAEEMIGDSIFKLIPPELHDTERELLQRLRAGERVEFSESERVRKDGARIWIALSVSPIRDETGAITGAASIKRDVTERRLLEDRLRDSQRLQAVGQLAGGIAHEANNQMSVVLGGAHFLLGRSDLPEPARADIEHIRRAAERTAAITQQLLAFSRRQTLELQDVDLNDVVRSIAPVLARSLAENQTLTIRPGTLHRAIRADPRQLEQVLLNLALNARDAMPEGGDFAIETIEVERTDPSTGDDRPTTYAALIVSDTGQGMSPATLDRAFEPFYTTKEVGRGTGLGLSVVHGIVNQLGGHIRVKTAPGEGAEFKLFFPVVPVESRGGATEAEAVESPGGGVALVVEDDAVVRGMAVRALAEGGYTVLEAANGRAALNLVRQHTGRLDIVVTDVGMPEMDGYDLARELQQLRPELPVIFVTGYGDHRGRSRPALATMPVVVEKPVSPAALVRIVGHTIQAHAASLPTGRTA